MKKIFYFLICFILISLIVVFSIRNFYYAQEFIVTETDYENDIVTIETSTGFQYQFQGVEDWFVGDHCICLMFNSFTKIITDDIIINTRYCGF